MNEDPPRYFLFHGYVVKEASDHGPDVVHVAVLNCRNWAKPDLDPKLFVNESIRLERGSAPFVEIRADDPNLIPIRPGRLRRPVRTSQQEAEDMGLEVHMLMTVSEADQVFEDRYGKLHDLGQAALYRDYVLRAVSWNERVYLLYSGGALVLPAPPGSLCVGRDSSRISMYIPVEPGDPDLELLGKFC